MTTTVPSRSPRHNASACSRERTGGLTLRSDPSFIRIMSWPSTILPLLTRTCPRRLAAGSTIVPFRMIASIVIHDPPNVVGAARPKRLVVEDGSETQTQIAARAPRNVLPAPDGIPPPTAA